MVPDSEKRARVAEFQRRHRLALLTLLFTDMVDSTQLKQTLGDRAAMALIEEHHRLLLAVLDRFPEAEEIERAGDSYFLVFTRPSDAVHFALLLQRGLRDLEAEGAPPLRDRIGIHVGEVMVDADATRLLGGLQIDTCARLMQSGAGDQILLSRFSFDSARQALRGGALAGLGPLTWLSHGHYLFKGLDEPVEVCEVGETDRAHLAAPANTEKAHRCATPDGEPVLGWRPAVGQQVPGTSWVLERNLGEGGFGEVWLGQHAVLKQRRVFKFCFRADRARSLKREVTIFRLLRERVGEHPHIVTVHDVYFDEPPFYLVMDYVEGAALPGWAEARGGLAAVPLPLRLELVAQVADALQVAHGAGVVHRDVKPSNVLVGGTAEAPQVKLADFGIGQVVSAEALGGITQLGFTQTMISAGSYSGTHIYLSPESLTGQAATARSDIYSLGVVLFQMIAGDFARPLTTDWADAIDEPLLCEDLRKCFASDPARRFAGAAQLAQQLRTLPQRQHARDAERMQRANAARVAYRKGVLRAAAVAVVIIAAMAALALVARQQAGRARLNAGTAARERDRAEKMLTRMEMQRAEELLSAHDNAGGLAYLARVVRRDPRHPVAVPRLVSALVDRSHPRPLTDRLLHEKMVRDVAFSPDGALLAVTTPDETRLWDAATGRLVLGPLAMGGYRLLFTPDGTRLVIMGFDARIVEVATGKVLAELDANPEARSGEARPDAQLSADGTTLLTISARNEVLLWNALTGARIGPPLAHDSEVWSARFSPDGRQLITGTDDGRVQLWDTARGVRLREWETGSRVLRVAFHPEGRSIGAGLRDGRVFLWNADTGAEIGQAGHHEEVSDLCFHADGTRLFSTAQDGTSHFLNAATGQALPEAPRTRYRVLGGALSADGMRMLTRTAEGVVFVRSLRDFELVVEPIRPGAIPLVAVFSPDGARVATGCADGSARIWQAEHSAAQPLHLWHGATVRDVATRGDTVATAGADGEVKIWDLRTARLTARLAHDRPVTIVRTSQAGGCWLTASEDGAMKLWDAVTYTLRGEQMQTAGRVVAADFNRDGRTFHIAHQGRAARVWDATTLQPLTPEFGTAATAAAVSGDGRFAVLGGDGGASIFDAPTGSPIGEKATHKAPVESVAISADQQAFATGSRDGSARVWTLATGAPATPEMNHGNVVRTVAFSPDSKLLVTTSYDRLARVWDARTGQPRGPGLPHPEVALAATFGGRENRTVLAGGSDGFVRTWDAESGMLLAEPQRIVGPVRDVWTLEDVNVAIGESAHRATVWKGATFRPPAPPWLADWAETVGGQRLDDMGALHPIPFSESESTSRRLLASSETDEFATAAKWFFTPPTQRLLAPTTPLLRPEYVRALGEMGTVEAAEYAVDLAPNAAHAWATLIRHRLGPDGTTTRAGDSANDWATRRAVALSPRHAEVWLARGLVLERRGDFTGAVEALDRGVALDANSSAIRAARARVLTAAGRAAEAAPENLALRGLPARDPEATDRQVDLSAYYNCGLDEDPVPGDVGNTFEELPRGLQAFGAVEWDVRGIVQLGNRDRLRRFPLAVTGMPVGGKCAALHFLHAAEFVQEAPDTEIARYVIHYADGGHITVPLRNGRELGDWWGEPLAPLEAVWHGSNQLTRAKGSRLNLFRTMWTNPRPEAAIATIDFISAGTTAAPFLVAVTRE